ncbi:translation initiation factor IF-2-like [Vulpes lagopus]|uniref:translation initiation factor IF-2-like n=1 Tax=Vulpes lagopus TaxID=494514 RepID=UPI001BC9EDA8|nr:translation initiation factor IF-2-like [Vulpes lagopus]
MATRARPPTRGLRRHPPTRPTWPPKPEPACRAAAAAAAAASPTSPVPAQPPAPAGHFRSHTHFRSLPGRAAPRRHFRFDPSRTRTQGRRGGWAGACATPPSSPGPRPRLAWGSDARGSVLLLPPAGPGGPAPPFRSCQVRDAMRKPRLSGEFICPRSQNCGRHVGAPSAELQWAPSVGLELTTLRSRPGLT